MVYQFFIKTPQAKNGTKTARPFYRNTELSMSMINNNRSILQVLSTAKRSLYLAIIRESSQETIQALIEIFYNLGQLRFPLSPSDLVIFQRHAGVVEILGDTKTSRGRVRRLLESHYDLVQKAVKLALLHLFNEDAYHSSAPPQDVLSQ